MRKTFCMLTVMIYLAAFTCRGETNNMTQLDRALDVVQRDKSKRDEFYNLFLNTEVYIPTHGASNSSNNQWRRSQEGETFQPIFIEKEGIPYILIFDTYERLAAWTEGRQITYVQMPAHSLVRSLSDPKIHIALNVGTSYPKIFVPDEIEWLRSECKVRVPREYDVPAGTRIIIGLPAEIPSGLEESLRRYLERNNEIEAAYLGLVHFVIEGEKPHLYLVLKMGNNIKQYFKNIQEEIGIAIQGFLEEGDSMTIEIYDGKGVSADIVKAAKPFYVKKK